MTDLTPPTAVELEKWCQRMATYAEQAEDAKRFTVIASYLQEYDIFRKRFGRTVKAENTLINIYSGKDPVPTDREWFFELAKQIGVPED